MKILYYKENGNWVPGIVIENGVIPVKGILKSKGGSFLYTPFNTEDIEKLLKDSNDSREILKEENLVIGPCVPNPSKIICIGLNYRKHAIESGMPIPDSPIVFSKYNNTLTEYGANIPLGLVGEQFDYEVELGVVIGSRCKNISKKDALDYVFGYCVANDLSCRDLQFQSSQWLLGKSLDRFLPLGKYLITKDEIIDPQHLQLTCSLNGQQRQNSNTSDMIFSVAEIISFLSRYMTLEPGDLILTGTPEGVIMGLAKKEWLKSGDIVKVEIENLGFTENKMV